MKKKGLIVLMTLMLPMSMLGSTELVYTWGYGEAFNEALQALKGLITESDYLVKMALAIALFVFSISKALDSKSNPVFEIGKLFMLYGVVYFFFLSPSNNTYIIHDEVTNKEYKVSQLPMGIGNTISLMSRLEKAILDGMEKHYSTPNSIAYSQAGLGFSLNAMMDIPSLRPASNGYINLQTNMDYYVRNCLQYNTISNVVDMNDVISTSALAEVLFPIQDGKIGIYYDSNTKKSSLMGCGEVAKKLRNDFEEAASELLTKYAHKAGIGTLTNFVTKFENAMSLYFGQAVGAREQFQQALVMNSLDDGIINTAKILGLNAQSLAANTAIADQTITTSMQAQGRLAQTYLPLAKAYMTIIVVSVSWLMAIISIMFGSYTHIKMFFTLCLSMVLWTPILSIINYLNDLNIQHTFADLVLKDDGALTYTNFKEVVTKVTENSNFLKYLVMLTPMLAYALAKGSEMGFVSIASSLSQQLAGGARAAGGFATQQALSTSTAITTPRGDEVYAREAGVTSQKGAFYDGSGNLTQYSTNADGYGGINNSTLNNSDFSGTNVGGIFKNGRMTSGTTQIMESIGKSASHDYQTQLSDARAKMHEDGTMAILQQAHGKKLTESDSYAQKYISNLQEQINSGVGMSDKTATEIQAFAKASVGSGKLIPFVNAEAGVQGSVGHSSAAEKHLSKEALTAWNDMQEKAMMKTIAEDQSITSSLQKNETIKNSTTFSSLVTDTHNYNETMSSVQAVNGDTFNNIMNGYARELAANNGADWNSLSTAQQDRYFAEAGAALNTMAQHDRGSLAALNKQYGGGTLTQGSFGTTQAGTMNLGSNANPHQAFGKNEGIVTSTNFGSVGMPDYCGRFIQQGQKLENGYFNANTAVLKFNQTIGNWNLPLDRQSVVPKFKH